MYIILHRKQPNEGDFNKQHEQHHVVALYQKDKREQCQSKLFPVLQAPFNGTENSKWFDYVQNVLAPWNISTYY